MNNLVYKNTPILGNKEFLSLTDMWKAVGSPPSRRPNDWLRTASTRSFVEKINKLYFSNGRSGRISTPEGKVHTLNEAVTVVRQGNDSVTFAHWQVALAYAAHLDEDFRVWCNEVIRKELGQQPTEAPAPALPEKVAPKRELTRDVLECVDKHLFELQDLGLVSTEKRLSVKSNFLNTILNVDVFPTFVEPQAALVKTYPAESNVVIVDEPPPEKIPDGYYLLSTWANYDFLKDKSKDAPHELRSRLLAIGEQLSQQRVACKWGDNVKSISRRYARMLRDAKLHPHAAKDYAPPSDLKEGLMFRYNPNYSFDNETRKMVKTKTKTEVCFSADAILAGILKPIPQPVTQSVVQGVIQNGHATVLS